MNSDWEYLSSAKQGDEIAAKVLFNKYNKIIFKIAGLITGSLDAAKDITQESFIRLFNASVVHNNGNFKSYLTTIAYRLALKEKYRFSKNRSVYKEDIKINSDLSLYTQEKNETKKIIFSAINSLPDKQKEILVLRFYGNHSYEEISEITNVPIGTVKSRIYYAVQECRKILKKKGLFDESLR
jgi:RNA polymerase sigma-70 factor (ECF subfamily)